MFYEPKDGHGLPHDPFKAIVAPRPIGWISTAAPDGSVNLAPYSFFNAVVNKPPIVMFSSEGDKDTVSLARESGEFVCNFASAALAEQINQTSAPYDRGVSEFERVGLAAAPSRLVGAPRVAAAPAALECVVTHIMTQTDRDGAELPVWTVFGQVVGVHIDDRFLDNGLFDTVRADPLTRIGYLDFGMLGDIVSMQRPKP